MPRVVGDTELRDLLQTVGVPLVWGSVASFGILRRADQVGVDGSGVTVGKRRQVCYVVASEFAGVQLDDLITIDGADYRVFNLGETAIDGGLALTVGPEGRNR